MGTFFNGNLSQLCGFVKILLLVVKLYTSCPTLQLPLVFQTASLCSCGSFTCVPLVMSLAWTLLLRSHILPCCFCSRAASPLHCGSNLRQLLRSQKMSPHFCCRCCSVLSAENLHAGNGCCQTVCIWSLEEDSWGCFHITFSVSSLWGTNKLWVLDHAGLCEPGNSKSFVLLPRH